MNCSFALGPTLLVDLHPGIELYPQVVTLILLRAKREGTQKAVNGEKWGFSGDVGDWMGLSHWKERGSAILKATFAKGIITRCPCSTAPGE